MATTKIWPVHDSLKRLVDYAGNPEKTEHRDLQLALHYAGNSQKTTCADEHFYYVSGVGCDPEAVYEQMTAVKQHFGKQHGNVAYHGYQSFKPEEVTPEQCHEIGVKLAKRLWGDRYQVLVATHLNKKHLHNHFLINSVSYVNGKKFNDDKHCYFQMREASDALCREFALSVIKSPIGHTPRSLYFAEKNGEPTKLNLMREAIAEALNISSTPQDFREALRERGYELRNDTNRKYATIIRIGSEKAVRLFRLGEEYDIPAIEEKLRENRCRYGSQLYWRYRRSQPQTFQLAGKYQMKSSLTKAKRIGGLRGLYLHYCYLLGILPKNSGRRPLSPELREEWRHIDEISRQVKLICREKFDTAADVQSFIGKRNSDLELLTAARNRCYNQLRRCEDPEAIIKIRHERDGLTKQIATLRKEIKTAQGVLDRSEAIHKNRNAELAMRAEQQREHLYRIKSERSYER